MQDLGLFLLFSNSGMKYTCQFRSARSAFEVFENLHMDPLSFLTL